MADLPALPLSVASRRWQHSDTQMFGRVKEGKAESSTGSGQQQTVSTTPCRR